MDTATINARVTLTFSGRQQLEFQQLLTRERLSTPYHFELDVLGKNGLALERLRGAECTVRMAMAKRRARYYHGIVDEVHALQGDNAKRARYRLILRSRLHRLAHSSDLRLFSEQRLIDVAEFLLSEHGIDYQFDLTGVHEALELVVQYGETDLEFFHRLLAEAGIYYWFRHEASRHVVVLSDRERLSTSVAGYETIKLIDANTPEGVLRLTPRVESRFDRVELDDHDWRHPQIDLHVGTGATRRGIESSIKRTYPGGYRSLDDGQRVAGIRLNQLRSERRVAEGVGSARGLQVGAVFQLNGHKRRDQNIDHAVIETNFRAIAGPPTAAGSRVSVAQVSCTFTTIPDGDPLPTPEANAVNTLHGPHTGVVVGPSGEAVFTDEFGRVKVRLNWDQANDFQGAPWMRVAQPWAGSGHGKLHVPRIGDEVVVEFEHGDPRRPIVTGSLYNAEAQPPVPLPDQQSVSVWHSESLDRQGGSEIRLDDASGAVQLTLSTSGDMGATVGQNASSTVGGNQTISIGGAQTESIGGNHTLSVDNNQSVLVHNDAVWQVDRRLTLTTGKDATLAVSGTFKIIAQESIELVTENASITLQPNGKISIKGSSIDIHTTGLLSLKGSQIVEQEN